MLHALLHGKLDLELPEPHRREDALTSIVFGTLRMVEAWDVLANWLDVEPLSSGQEGTVACWFWPRLAGAVEPDVVLRLGDTLVVVEAKYRSGRHDLSLDEGVVARIVTGPHDANRQDPHRPMRYDTGRPRAVIRLRISQPRTASLPCPAGLRARRPSPMMDL